MTPPHITELFTELAGIDGNSVLLDNCCGSGGFLISAMKKMFKDAYGNSQKIAEIKDKQIIGIEYLDDIYALAITNMVIHGDGRSNVQQGDCFKIGATIKNQYQPNVGFLNPPYKTDKDDIEELEFVLNNLETLGRGNTCIAIIPISCVSAQSGNGLELKRRLLKNHTLEAVMSMPSELFHNSDVAVVTAIIVLTAHTPHPTNKKTWFGYWRDDGFVKVKNLGRIDNNNTWPEICDRWVSAFRNREIIPEFSVTEQVTPEDEWCAEAYLETNYSNISRLDFEKELREYLAFKVRQGEWT